MSRQAIVCELLVHRIWVYDPRTDTRYPEAQVTYGAPVEMLRQARADAEALAEKLNAAPPSERKE